MQKINNVKQLCEFIWYLEQKYGLLDFEVAGVKPWQAQRIEIYYELGRRCGVFEKTLQRGMSKSQKFKSLFTVLKNSVIHNPFNNLHPVDALVFSHPRSKFVDGEYVDIYTTYLLEEFMNKGETFYEFEGHFDGRHIRKKMPYTKYLDYFNLYSNLQKNLIKIDLSSKKENLLTELQKEIKQTIGTQYNVKNILLDRTKKFITKLKLYRKILKRTKPEKIFLLVSYGRPEIIQAAKELGITTIELQHGTFSRYHLGYSFEKKSLDYFPDEFWVWNDFWKNMIDFPIDSKNVKIYPFKYMEKEKKKYLNVSKKENQMVILCQSGLTDRMAKKILDNIAFFENFTLVFKLHPEEYGKRDSYKSLQELMKKKKDVEIVEDIDLYQLLAESEYQAGVFSTALYEGIEFKCKTVLFDLPGIEYMKMFQKSYKAKLT